MSDITPIRTEFSTLIDNLSKLYLQEEEKAPREQARQCTKQKESSKNVNDDAIMSTSKDEVNVEGDLARASVEKENSSPPPTMMTLAGPQPMNPPHPLLWYLLSKVSHRLLPLSKFDIKRDLRTFDSLVYKDEGNVDGDSSTNNDNYNSPPNKKQRNLPMQGESMKYSFASEDDLHKMTCSNLLNDLDTWICTSCKVDLSSLVILCLICNSYIPIVPLAVD
jgi:hypothetical protein